MKHCFTSAAGAEERIRSYPSENRLNLGDRLLFDGKDDNDEVHVAEPGSTAEADLRAVCFDDWKYGK
jgi:hypothetical protein